MKLAKLGKRGKWETGDRDHQFRHVHVFSLSRDFCEFGQIGDRAALISSISHFSQSEISAKTNNVSDVLK